MSKTSKPYLIVVGTDYSELAALALESACDIAAEKAQAELHVVHVLSYVAGAQSVPGAAVHELGEPAARLTAHVESALTLRQARGAPVPSRTVTHIRLDQPAQEVAQLAADLEADLVVVGTHGRQGLSRLLLGSVAETTIRLAPCPVLVVRPKAVPEPLPRIEPPCPRCLEARKSSGGKELWCAQHKERHGQRHTYHQTDRVSSETNMPLVVQR